MVVVVVLMASGAGTPAATEAMVAMEMAVVALAAKEEEVVVVVVLVSAGTGAPAATEAMVVVVMAVVALAAKEVVVGVDGSWHDSGWRTRVTE